VELNGLHHTASALTPEERDDPSPPKPLDRKMHELQDYSEHNDNYKILCCCQEQTLILMSSSQ